MSATRIGREFPFSQPTGPKYYSAMYYLTTGKNSSGTTNPKKLRKSAEFGYFSGNIISGLTHYLIKKLGCISKHLPWLSGRAVVYHVRPVDLFSLPPQYFFWKKYKSKPVRNLLQTSLQRNFCLTSPKFFAIFSSKLIKDINAISAWMTWVDMELWSYLPRVPFLPLDKKRTLGR